MSHCQELKEENRKLRSVITEFVEIHNKARAGYFAANWHRAFQKLEEEAEKTDAN